MWGGVVFLLSSKKTLLVGIFFYNATIYIFYYFQEKIAYLKNNYYLCSDIGRNVFLYILSYIPFDRHYKIE